MSQIELRSLKINLLEKYKGSIVKRTEYEKWSFDFFHDKSKIENPTLNMTLNLDISKHYTYFQDHLEPNHFNTKEQKHTFTSFLMYILLRSLQKIPEFLYRKIEGEWYHMKNLPVFFPIAIESEKRFGNGFIENIFSNNVLNEKQKNLCVENKIDLEDAECMTYEEFSNEYRNTVSNNLKDDLTEEEWANSIFIGNLPNIQFTSFTLHKPVINNGKSYFYFGRRFYQDSKLMIPLSVTMDHANTDPLMLSKLIEAFNDLSEFKRTLSSQEFYKNYIQYRL